MAITRRAVERRLKELYEDLEKDLKEGRLQDPGMQVAYNTLGVLRGVMLAGEPLLGAWNIVVNNYAKNSDAIRRRSYRQRSAASLKGATAMRRRHFGAFVFIICI